MSTKAGLYHEFLSVLSTDMIDDHASTVLLVQTLTANASASGT